MQTAVDADVQQGQDRGVERPPAILDSRSKRRRRRSEVLGVQDLHRTSGRRGSPGPARPCSVLPRPRARAACTCRWCRPRPAEPMLARCDLILRTSSSMPSRIALVSGARDSSSAVASSTPLAAHARERGRGSPPPPRPPASGPGRDLLRLPRSSLELRLQREARPVDPLAQTVQGDAQLLGERDAVPAVHHRAQELPVVILEGGEGQRDPRLALRRDQAAEGAVILRPALVLLLEAGEASGATAEGRWPRMRSSLFQRSRRRIRLRNWPRDSVERVVRQRSRPRTA